jgi:peptidoglycan-associated lipoprotein
MRSKTLLSISLLSIAALSSACSRHKVSASATPATTSSPNQAAIDAAARENARLRADADDNSEREAAAARSRTAAGDQAALTLPVYFEFDRSEITEDGMRLLDQKVDVLQRNPNVRVRIEGNADDSGSDEYNLALSQRRAAIAHRYFTDRGIDGSRLKVTANGEERPACTATREEDCRSKNRRDEFVIVSGF